MLKKSSIALITACISTPSMAFELDLELSPGYDDNPFKLADHLHPDGGWYTDVEVKAKQQFEDFRIRGKVAHRAYENNLDDADETTVTLDARYKKNYTISGKKAFSHLIVSYKDKNKTYVQRSTGQVGTFSGSRIENRYDYDAWGAEAKTAVYFTDALRIGLEVNYLNKDYNDPNVVGLSNLDYDQVTFSNDWNYEITDNDDVEIVVEYARREYDDKREKDLSGSSIAGTDLEYDYYSGAIGYEHKFSSDFSMELKASYEERRDSGEGYYDTDEFKLGAEINYTISPSLELAAGVTYRDKDYVNEPVSDEVDDVHPSTDGYTYKLHLEKDLGKVVEYPVAAFFGVQYDDYDSEDPNYEYDRMRAFAGVEISL